MKKILPIIGILALIGGIAGFMMYNKPHDDIRSAKADFEKTATELFTDFETDETAANAKFLDKIITVSGTIAEVSKDEEGKVSITLDGGGLMGGIICKLDDFSEHKRTDFTAGETVTLKGICTGMLMDVVLVRCVEL